MKGNNPAAWEKFLNLIDEKMQFNLLEHLRRAPTYHFESDVLFIEAENKAEADFLNKSVQTLTLFATDACKVREVRIREQQ